MRTLKEFGRIGKELKKGGKVKAVTLKRIDTLRRKLNNWIGAAKNRTDAAATTRIKAALDEWIDQANDQALFAGDDGAIEAWRMAISKRREQGRLFGVRGKASQDPAGVIVQKILEADPTPEQTINYLIGAGKLGGKANSAKAAARLKEIFGEGSEEWNALREAVWLRLSKDAAGKARSARMLGRTLDEAFEQNQTLLETLYTKPELALLKRLKSAVARTITPEDVKNPSKTAYTMARLFRDLLGRMGTMATFRGDPLGGALFFGLKRTPSFLGKRGARAAVKPYRPPQRRPRVLSRPAQPVQFSRLKTEQRLSW